MNPTFTHGRPSPPDGDLPERRRDATAFARTAFAREPSLVSVGAAGLLLSCLCLVAVGVRGTFIPPEGKMLDAVRFTFGVGLFTLTMALLLPLAGYSSRARRRWLWGYLVFAGYGLAVESIQSFRGLDPRFPEAGGPLDVIVGIVFGVTAALNVVVFVLLGLRFLRSDVMADRPNLRLGIRYGSAAVALSFAVGILMGVVGGRGVGDAGDLLVSHGLGVHGIQALPLVAVLVRRTDTAARARVWIHAVGIGWLAATAVALAQALLGRPPFETSLLTVLIVAGLLVAWVATGHVLFSWRRWGTPTVLPPETSLSATIGQTDPR